MDAVQESLRMDLDDEWVEASQKSLRWDWDYKHAKLSLGNQDEELGVCRDVKSVKVSKEGLKLSELRIESQWPS